MNKTRISDINR